MSVEKTNFKSDFTFKHLCYTNKKRIEINDIMMMKRYKAYKKTPLKLSKSEFDENSQDVILCPQVPVIAHVNCKKLDIVNNEEFVIKKITQDQILITNSRKELIICIGDFQRLFYVAYAMTIHKSQGCTFDFDYTIHEWDKLDQRLRYVALTRATDLKYINVI
jgi:hypothetical protein